MPPSACSARAAACPPVDSLAAAPISHANDTPARRSVTRWFPLLAAVAAAVVAVDQVTKGLALANLRDGAIDVWWTLRLNLHFNEGGAFGFGQGMAPFFVAAGMVLLTLLLLASRRVTGPAMATALGLIVGGAVGNLVDRLLRDHGGAVVDFIDLQWWPIFNVADAAITCGAALLLLTGGRRPPEE